MPEPKERILSKARVRGGWLFLAMDDGSELPLPPGWDCPGGVLKPGARVVIHETSEAWTVSIAGFVLFCVDADAHIDRRMQRPAVLGGPPIVMVATAPSRPWVLARLVTRVPGAPRTVTVMVDKVRYTAAGHLPLMEMLKRNPQLPFAVPPMTLGRLGDTRLYYYRDRWNLPIEVIRRWLAAELKVELDENDGPEDGFIRLPESFFARKGAVRQLELALLKLGNWRQDGAFLEWVLDLTA